MKLTLNMKPALKWVSLIFALASVVFMIYGLASTVDMWGDMYIGTIAMLFPSLMFVGGGAIFVCVGAFKENKNLIIIGIITFVLGVILLFSSVLINVRYLNRLE